MIHLLCVSLLLVAADVPATDQFAEVEIETPFDSYLAANPLPMDVTGAKVIHAADASQIVISVASTVLEGDSPRERLRAEKVCRTKALAYVLAERDGVEVFHMRRAEERTVIISEDGKERAESVSEVLEVTRAQVKGIVKDMPIVGRWKSKDVFYIGIGAVLPADHDRPIGSTTLQRRGET